MFLSEAVFDVYIWKKCWCRENWKIGNLDNQVRWVTWWLMDGLAPPPRGTYQGSQYLLTPYQPYLVMYIYIGDQIILHPLLTFILLKTSWKNRAWEVRLYVLPKIAEIIVLVVIFTLLLPVRVCASSNARKLKLKPMNLP